MGREELSARGAGHAGRVIGAPLLDPAARRKAFALCRVRLSTVSDSQFQFCLATI